jgi:hypothetical protein
VGRSGLDLAPESGRLELRKHDGTEKIVDGIPQHGPGPWVGGSGPRPFPHCSRDPICIRKGGGVTNAHAPC